MNARTAFIAGLLMATAAAAPAQTQSGASQPAQQKTLAATMNVYVFPT